MSELLLIERTPENNPLFVRKHIVPRGSCHPTAHYQYKEDLLDELVVKTIAGLNLY